MRDILFKSLLDKVKGSLLLPQFTGENIFNRSSLCEAVMLLIPYISSGNHPLFNRLKLLDFAAEYFSALSTAYISKESPDLAGIISLIDEFMYIPGETFLTKRVFYLCKISFVKDIIRLSMLQEQPLDVLSGNKFFVVVNDFLHFLPEVHDMDNMIVGRTNYLSEDIIDLTFDPVFSISLKENFIQDQEYMYCSIPKRTVSFLDFRRKMIKRLNS